MTPYLLQISDRNLERDRMLMVSDPKFYPQHKSTLLIFVFG